MAFLIVQIRPYLLSQYVKEAYIPRWFTDHQLEGHCIPGHLRLCHNLPWSLHPKGTSSE